MELDHDHLFTGNHELWDLCSIHLHLSEEGLAGNGWILMQHVLLETYYLLFQKHQGHFANVAQHSCLTTEKTLIIRILAIQHDFVKPRCLWSCWTRCSQSVLVVPWVLSTSDIVQNNAPASPPLPCFTTASLHGCKVHQRNKYLYIR